MEENNLKRTVGASIGVARRRRGLSQRSLAESVGANAGQISDWENGRYLPGLASLVAIARTLAVTLDYLVLGEQGLEDRFAALERRFDERLTASERRYDERLMDLDRQIGEALGH